MKNTYIETILLIERLHRRFLDVIRAELDRLRITEINNVQTLILYNINNEQISIGELTNRGYYLGSNVSYNVKDLVDKGFLIKEKSPHDKRSMRVKLSEKGLELCQKIDELYQRNLASMEKFELDINTFPDLNSRLQKLEQFWTSCVNNIFRN